MSLYQVVAQASGSSSDCRAWLDSSIMKTADVDTDLFYRFSSTFSLSRYNQLDLTIGMLANEYGLKTWP